MTPKREKLLAGLEVCRRNKEWDQSDMSRCFMGLTVPDFLTVFDSRPWGTNAHRVLAQNYYNISELEFIRIFGSSTEELEQVIDEIAPE